MVVQVSVCTIPAWLLPDRVEAMVCKAEARVLEQRGGFRRTDLQLKPTPDLRKRPGTVTKDAETVCTPAFCDTREDAVFLRSTARRA